MSVTHTLEEEVPRSFHFESTVRAHGWVALRPFEWQADPVELRRVHRLDSGKVVRLRLQESRSPASPTVQVTVETADRLDAVEQDEVRRVIRRMLRLDEDLSEFHQMHAQMAGWTLQLPPGGGRLLRCPTLFEDIVYTLCTTNIAWSGTKRMVHLLVEKLGDGFPGRPAWRAFPTPAAIAAAGPDFLRSEIGLGYRSAYLDELATAVAEGRLDLNGLEDPGRPAQEIRQELLRIKGIGNYSAATVLMLLGRYEYLAIDTELRSFVSNKYFAGEPVDEDQIRALYAPWGRWRYLAYWFDTPAEES